MEAPKTPPVGPESQARALFVYYVVQQDDAAHRPLYG